MRLAEWGKEHPIFFPLHHTVELADTFVCMTLKLLSDLFVLCIM